MLHTCVCCHSVEGEGSLSLPHLRVLQVELVQHERRLLADVNARGREHRDDVANEVTRELLGRNCSRQRQRQHGWWG